MRIILVASFLFLVACSKSGDTTTPTIAAESYTPTFSAYTPEIPEVVNPCDGTTVSVRNTINCSRDSDHQLVENSKCFDRFAKMTYTSPAGTIKVPVDNGYEVYSCPQGSKVQTFVKKACDTGYYDNGTSCVVANYAVTYTAYDPPVPSSLPQCGGTVISYRNVQSCVRTNDNTVVDASFCPNDNPMIITKSPAGGGTNVLVHGTESYTCAEGSATKVYTRSCDPGYDYTPNGLCTFASYTPTYSSYSPSVPFVNNICDGTIISNRTITSCVRGYDLKLMPTSYCNDPIPQIITRSPAGDITRSIDNGTSTYHCDLGLGIRPSPPALLADIYKDRVWSSRVCNTNFHSNGLPYDYGDSHGCVPDTYTPFYSPYTPTIPKPPFPQVCDGTTVSTRSMSCNRDHDGAVVSNSFCPVDSLATVTTLSPAGTIAHAIPNGAEIFSCASGSTTQVFTARNCNTNFHNDGVACVADQYLASYSSYSPTIPTSPQVCDGTTTSTRVMTCTRIHDGAVVSNSFCPVDSLATVNTPSPAGTINQNIANGIETYSCSAGSSTKTFVSRTCNSTFHNTGSACIGDTYTPLYSSYSPAIPALTTCGGTVVSNRSMTCQRDYDLAIVSNSFCPADIAATVTSQSPAGTVNQSITNGSEIYSCSTGSTTKTFVSRSCNSGYHNDGTSCVADQFVASYSGYTPSIPTSPAACSGTVISNRTMTCTRTYDNTVVANSFCPADTSASVTTKSPAGNVNQSISNGFETYSCSLGSTSKSFVSRTCDTNFHNNGAACVADTFTPIYSAYSPSVPSSQNSCDGTVVSTRTMTCQRDYDLTIVSNSFCSADPIPTITSKSPEGNITQSIANGSEVYSCPLGSTTKTFVSRSCNLNYHDGGSSCVADQYVASYSSYTPPIPSSQNTCDGTVTSTRTMTCTRTFDNAVVSNSFCPADTFATVTSQSPSGNINKSIANGTETYSCATGSTTQLFVSRSCNSAYYNTGSACALITYSSIFSAYSPLVPSSQSPCDGTVVSTRTMTCQRNDNFTTVSNSFCSADPTPSVTSQSPAGNKVVGISNGSETYSCPFGSTTQTFVSRSCNTNYHNTGSGCALDTYTPIYSSYSPAIPSSQVACDGTVVSTRTMTCQRDYDSAIVSNSICPVDSAASVTSQSPAGNKVITITNGTETYSCPLGSTTQSFVTRTCDAGSYDTGTACKSGFTKISSDFSDSGSKEVCGIVGKRTFCWGNNNQGQLATGNSVNANSATVVTNTTNLSGKDIVDLTWSGHTFIVRDSASKMYGWGLNNISQIGNNQAPTGSFSPVTTPLRNDSTGALNTKTVNKSYLYGSAGFAIDSLGVLYGWGSNGNGEMATGSTTVPGYYITPTKLTSGLLSGKVLAALESSNGYSFYALTTAGKVLSWGDNTYGQIGNGVANSSTILTAYDLSTNSLLSTKVVSKIITTSKYSVFAIDSTGAVYGWGNDVNYQLGTGTNSTKTVPTLIGGAISGKVITDLKSNIAYTLALDSNGIAYEWGTDFGTGFSKTTPSAIAVPGSEAVSAIFLVRETGCLKTVSKKVYCFGVSGVDTSGNILRDSSYTLKFSSLDLIDLVGTTSSVIMISKDGKAYGTGQNTTGELGVGDFVNKSTYTPLIVPIP